MTEKTHSPEYRLAQGAISGLRQDLFHEPFAYRPLPPLRPDGPLVRRLPGERIRRAAVWLPHGIVLFVAFCVMLSAGATGNGDFNTLLFAIVPTGAVAMTLIRPVGAWWVSIVSTPFVSVLGGSWDDWPWSVSGFLSHLTVMIVVAMRTRPRTAGWMWVITAAYAVFADTFLSRGYGSDAPGMLFTSAVCLLVVSMLH